MERKRNTEWEGKEMNREMVKEVAEGGTGKVEYEIWGWWTEKQIRDEGRDGKRKKRMSRNKKKNNTKMCSKEEIDWHQQDEGGGKVRVCHITDEGEIEEEW